jgi:hypothetical protein
MPEDEEVLDQPERIASMIIAFRVKSDEEHRCRIPNIQKG